MPPSPGLRALETGEPHVDGGVAAYPLAVGRRAPVGVLVLDLRSALDVRARAQALELAAVAGALLENERRLRASALEARQDALTGLRNRRAFDEHLAALIEARGRPGLLSLVFCDLDDFKAVNDREGYTTGDQVLREVARALASELRPGEELFRIGGDEFAVVVTGSRSVGEVVGARLEATLMRRRRGPRLPRVSTGVAAFPDDGRTVEELIGRAAQELLDGRRSRRRSGTPALTPPARGLRLLAVDDDASLRLLLRTTFELADISVDEAETAEQARAAIARHAPDVIVLDVSLPGTGGLQLTRSLRADPATAEIPIVVLTGGDLEPLAAREAGSDALVRKPFSPLELLATVERVAGATSTQRPLEGTRVASAEDQLLLYAGDLRRLLELERQQRRAVESAYRETVGALASVLEMRDLGTGEHSLRVQRYASALAEATAPELLADTSVEYGFLLHDIGKIGIPDSILQKPGPLDADERRVMETHAPLGAQILAEIAQLHGHGLEIVRHHHERWDGRGYPDRLSGAAIPLGARIFAVADALDAMTSERPYRPPRSWEEAVAEIHREAGRQFDPAIVGVFRSCEGQLRRIHEELAAV